MATINPYNRSKVILLLPFLFLTVFVNAQTWNQQHSAVKSLFGKNEFAKAEPLAKYSIELAKTEYGDSSKQYIQASILYISVLNELEEYTDAIEFGTIASNVAEKQFGATDSLFLACLVKTGLAHKGEFDLASADSIFTRVIFLKEQIGHIYDPEYVAALEYFAEKFYADEEYRQSFQYHRRIIRALRSSNDTLSEKYSYSKEFINHLINEKGVSETDDPWLVLDNKISALIADEDFFGAEELIPDYIESALNEFGSAHRNYYYTTLRVRTIQLHTGSLEGYINAYETGLKSIEDHFGRLDTLYERGLNDLLGYYESVAYFIESGKVYKRLLQIDIERKDTTSEKHIEHLNGIVGAAVSNHNYDDAANEMQQLLAVYNKTRPANDSVYLYARLAMAEYQIKRERYSSALDMYLELFEIIKKEDNNSGGRYSALINKIAGTYSELGNYEEAEKYFRLSVANIEKVLGKEHEYFYNGLNNIAATCLQYGNYTEAESLFRQILDHDRKVLRTKPKNYAITLQNLANLYSQMNRTQEEKALLDEALSVVKSTLGTENSQYALCLYYSALGDLYMKQFDSAKVKLNEAIRIDRHLKADGDRHYLYYLQALGTVYKFNEQITESTKTFRIADSIIIKNYGKEHILYAKNLSFLANLAAEAGNLPESERLHQQSLKITLKSYGGEHKEYADELYQLGLIYAMRGNIEQALKCYSDFERISYNFIFKNFAGLSEKEKMTWAESASSNGNLISSLLYKHPSFRKQYNVRALNNRLQVKGIVLNESSDVLKVLHDSRDPKVNNLLTDWLRLKSALAREYALALKERNPSILEWETKANNLEKEINIISSGIIKQGIKTVSDFSSIRSSLKDNQAAIEFLRFDYFDNNWTDSVIYAAYIIRKRDSIPQFVSLFEERQLEKYFTTNNTVPSIKSLYRSDAVDEEDNTVFAGDSLYGLIWKPLLPYLDGISEIKYSPAGLLYKIAFHALPTPDSLLLIDKYSMKQFLRLTPSVSEPEDSMRSIGLFGNCLFSLESKPANTKDPERIRKLPPVVPAGLKTKSVGWKSLPGTAEEVKGIAELFRSKSLVPETFLEAQATEEQFKSLSGRSPSILHLATHGFFLQDPEKKRKEGFETDNRNAFTQSSDPLLRSGIVLSGADKVWTGGAAVAGVEDGIVTAYEIAQMDLSKTNLVILSACESALGDIKGNEGVFGLQRAFKLAGVKNMILSLWKVPDAETSELMRHFYSYYLNGSSSSEAFNLAQKEMRKKHKPYSWAAFVFIE